MADRPVLNIAVGSDDQGFAFATQHGVKPHAYIRCQGDIANDNCSGGDEGALGNFFRLESRLIPIHDKGSLSNQEGLVDAARTAFVRSSEALGQHQHIRPRGIAIAFAAEEAPRSNEVQAGTGDGVIVDQGVLSIATIVIAEDYRLRAVQ